MDNPSLSLLPLFFLSRINYFDFLTRWSFQNTKLDGVWYLTLLQSFSFSERSCEYRQTLKPYHFFLNLITCSGVGHKYWCCARRNGRPGSWLMMLVMRSRTSLVLFFFLPRLLAYFENKISGEAPRALCRLLWKPKKLIPKSWFRLRRPRASRN